jgi:hypothetical protein
MTPLSPAKLGDMWFTPLIYCDTRSIYTTFEDTKTLGCPSFTPATHSAKCSLRTTTMPSLTATYTSPASSSQTFVSELPTMCSKPSTSDRVAYLSALSASLRKVQGEVNGFLTQKMADDKAADDAKDEETYGEEVVDED